MKLLLWDGNKELGQCRCFGRYNLEDDTERKNGKGIPLSVKKPVDGCLTAQPFGFGESVVV